MGRGGVSETLGGMSREDAVISGLRHAHAPQRLQALRVCRNQVRARGSPLPLPRRHRGGDGDGGCWRAPPQAPPAGGGHGPPAGPSLQSPLRTDGHPVRGRRCRRWRPRPPPVWRGPPRASSGTRALPPPAAPDRPTSPPPRSGGSACGPAHWVSSLLDRPPARRTGPPLDRRSTPGPPSPPGWLTLQSRSSRRPVVALGGR